MTWLLVALGAASGAAARHLGDRAVRSWWPGRFPWGILLVNLTGSLLLGLVVGAGVGPRWGALLAVGFCGAFTTWSTLALDVVTLARGRAWWPAALALAASLVGGLLAVAVGVRLGSGWA